MTGMRQLVVGGIIAAVLIVTVIALRAPLAYSDQPKPYNVTAPAPVLSFADCGASAPRVGNLLDQAVAVFLDYPQLETIYMRLDDKKLVFVRTTLLPGFPVETEE